MTRNPLFPLLLVVLLAVPTYAKPGIVKTNDGQTYEGEVDEKDPVAVGIVIKGIQTKIDRSKIASITYTGDKAAELQTRLTKLPANDVAGRIALAREAMNQQQYAIARDALEQARQIDPNNADAVALLDTVQSQIRMERTRTKPSEEGHVATTETAPAATQIVNDIKLLRPAEINAIRQGELRPDDVGVRVRLERNVLRRYVDFVGRDKIPTSFYSFSPFQQAMEILRNPQTPPEMKQDVMAMNDPPPLLGYRQRVQPFLLQSCATIGCHGGRESKFRLVTPAESDAATYTNFHILTRYVRPIPEAEAGVFGKPNPRMIDRQHPETSLLLQYALPGSISDYDHPDVRDYHPPLRSKSDPRYILIHDWIGSSLKPVDPDYGFDAPATTQPATDAASKPVTLPAPAAPPVRPNAPARPAPHVPPPPPEGVLR